MRHSATSIAGLLVILLVIGAGLCLVAKGEDGQPTSLIGAIASVTTSWPSRSCAGASRGPAPRV
jgi:hypothetical protein